MYKKILFTLLIFILLSTITSPVFAQQTETYPIYIIQKGDTLSLVADKFGTTVNEILAVNDIQNSNVLNLGMRINIPGFPGITGTLKIKVLGIGENLDYLSQKFQISTNQLALLNRITSSTALYAGSEIIVPIPDEQDDTVPPPSVMSSQSLIETAMVTGTTSWAIQMNNGNQYQWSMLPGDGYISPNGTKPINQNPITEITIDPLPLVQGATEVIHIKTSHPLSLSGDLSGHQFNFFQNGDNDYYALEGIHALDAPGLKSLKISTSENGVESPLLSQSILLTEGSYIQEAVNGVDPNTIDPVVIKQEDDILSTISNTSTTKLWDGPFKFPVDDPCPGSTFGNRRTYNNGAYHYYHTGVDFSVCKANNLNIYAAAPGVIIYTGLLPSKGNYTVIDHGWGVYSCYAHQSQFKVAVGDHVNTGDIIGIIGGTGRALGPHLHWEIWVNHMPIDPLAWTQHNFPSITP
jgi:murein DD-endopeptidase MepM/ murein hydrolase activator NlpD